DRGARRRPSRGEPEHGPGLSGPACEASETEIATPAEAQRYTKEAHMAQATLPPWIQALQQRDPEFVGSYMTQRERILRDGAIPAKYKHLMTMIVDALQSHPDGVANIANRARAAGASEAEVQEAVEVAYLFGGTPALVTAVNAFRV